VADEPAEVELERGRLVGQVVGARDERMELADPADGLALAAREDPGAAPGVQEGLGRGLDGPVDP
jgi:hypothetical protein